MSKEDPIVVWHESSVSREQREKLNAHRGCVVWFTGLSGSGKSTVANAVDRLLHERGVRTYVLDGDNVRHGLNATPAMLTEQFDEAFGQRFGLGFGQQDREENIRRVGAVARLMADAGLVTLTAFVSPYRKDRDSVRATVNAATAAGNDFVEVFVDTPLEVCESRDPKGLYKKARAGEIKNFTGIDAPYEAPNEAEITLDAGTGTPEELGKQVVEHLVTLGKLTA